MEVDLHTIKLECQAELRFVVNNPDDHYIVKITEGSAEIFGSKLLIGKEYTFSYFSSVAIFTWDGCIIHLRGKNKMFKIKRSKQINQMKNIHEHLDYFRENAKTRNSFGPVTLIMGPTDVGKSTLCRFLLNYAVRKNCEPIFIDLDVGQSSVSIPGTFAVLPVNQQSDIYGKFSEKELSVYYFGYKSPGHNMKLYSLLLEKLSQTLRNRLSQADRNIRNSGVIIDTCGWIDGAGYRIILQIIELFRVSIVVILGKKSLYFKMQDSLPKNIELCFVEKLNGVFTRNRNVRLNNRDSSVLEYFYGPSRNLKPPLINIKFSLFHIYKADSLENRENNHLTVVPVEINHALLHQIFALSYAENPDNILLSSVMGFICLTELDMESETAFFLSPKPGQLPSKYLLMGDIKLPLDYIHV